MINYSPLSTTCTLTVGGDSTFAGDVTLSSGSPVLKIEAKNANSFVDPALEFTTWNVASGASSGAIKLTNGTFNSNDMAFFTETSNSVTEKMRITSVGNVGIGTINPLTKLHIAGTTDANIIRLENTTTALSEGDTIGAVQFYNNDTTDNSPNVAASIYATAGASGGSGSLRFKTTEPGTEGDPATDTMIVTNGGRVGIGTTSPSEKLEVQDGNIKIETTTNVDAKLIFKRLFRWYWKYISMGSSW